ncbi:unnamed protein product, partial [Closterium sp. NIES-54]
EMAVRPSAPAGAVVAASRSGSSARVATPALPPLKPQKPLSHRQASVQQSPERVQLASMPEQEPSEMGDMARWRLVFSALFHANGLAEEAVEIPSLQITHHVKNANLLPLVSMTGEETRVDAEQVNSRKFSHQHVLGVATSEPPGSTQLKTNLELCLCLLHLCFPSLTSPIREDITFQDPMNTFKGVDNYRLIFKALRFHGKIFFKALCVDVLHVWQPNERTIQIRWSVRGIPRLPWEAHGRFDGTSEYKLDSSGKIYSHKVDNIVMSDPPKYQPLTVMELLRLSGAQTTPTISCSCRVSQSVSSPVSPLEGLLRLSPSMASASVSLLRRAARPILTGLYGGALSVAARQHLTSSCSSSAAAAGAAAATGAAAAGLRNAMAGFHSSACSAADLSQSSGPSVTEETVSLVQASDKGIGLAFVEQLLKRQPTGRVIATCRDPMGAQHLDALHDQSGGRLDVMQLDVTKEDTIEAVAAAVRQKYGKLDLLLNVAGVLHRPNELQPESSLHWLCQDAMLLAYRVNAMGPMLVLKHMMPLLVTGGHTNPNRPFSVVANMSSRTGSISDNHIGGWYSYRASKAALNQFTKTAAVELAAQKSPVVAVLLHPGTVDTDLTRPFTSHLPADQIFTPDFAADQLLGVIDGLSEKDNGRFIAYDGTDVAW